MRFDTIPHRLLTQAARRPSAPAYHVRVGGHWVATSYRRYAEEVRTVARALIGLGVPAGGTVCLLGFNRPEWAIVDLAAMMIGGVPAGIYTTCSADEVQYIVHHAEASVVLVEDAAQLAKLEARRASLPHLRHVVLMRGATAPAGTSLAVLSWDQLVAAAEPVGDDAVTARLEALAAGDLATLIYTSGTTGPPKGVMLSHGNLAWTAQLLVTIGAGAEDDVSLSYLPLSHIAEQTGTIHMPITSGASVYFAESIDKVADNLKEVRPTVFFGVPRIWEKLHAGIAGKLAQLTGGKKRLLAWTQGVGRRVHARRADGAPLGLALELQHRLADRLVLRKLKAAIGFDRTRLAISGAAPIGKDVLELFASLDLIVYEVYGQSEDTGPTSINLPGAVRLGTVGRPVPGVEVRLGDDGEILVRGPNVFLGYFKERAATAEALVDGWLHSGDLGAFDADGYLSITGRKKDILITAGGKNVAPRNIEDALRASPLVAEAVVIGDRRKYLTALLVLDEAALAGRGGDAAAPAVRAELQQAVDHANAALARVEQIKKFTVLPRPFSIEAGELTPTLKIKRAVVSERYADEIAAMYAE